MVNYGDLQFAERIMVARRSEMSAEWKVRFAICLTSVAIQAFTKLLFSFFDGLKTTNCTFQEVDNIFCLAVGIAVYDEFFYFHSFMQVVSYVHLLVLLCRTWTVKNLFWEFVKSPYCFEILFN
jgi:hypothetical protein